MSNVETMSNCPPSPDKNKVTSLFRRVTAKMYDKEVDFSVIEEALEDVRQSGRIGYEHLEIIANPEIWTFSKWWRWPRKEEIDDDLRGVDFSLLKGLSPEHDERWPVEKTVVYDLYYKVFRNLELVSLLLRFLYPEDYGIYSPPVLHYLNVPRGYSYGNEFSNYLKVLRRFRDRYKISRASETDVFIWALAMTQQKKLAEERKEIVLFFHRHVKKEIQARILYGVLEEGVFGKPDREIAGFFRDASDYLTAMKYAGCALEDILETKCKKKGIDVYVPGTTKRLPRGKYIEQLCRKTGNFEMFRPIGQVMYHRDRASHPNPPVFNADNVDTVLNLISQISKW